MTKLYSPPPPALIEKYDSRKGSWFTTYPYQSLWREDGAAAQPLFQDALRGLEESEDQRPLALYVHFPFCTKQCAFCQCAMIISHKREEWDQYLDALEEEARLLAALLKSRAPSLSFNEAHFGGGSPSLLDERELTRLIRAISPLVDVGQLDEFSIEIDPRFDMSQEKMRFYAKMGINRISFGIQDFDPAAQKAVHRVNPPEMIEELLVDGVRQLFPSVSFDILYGLPLQTPASHAATMERVLAFAPDRVSVCALGHRPDIFPHQKSYDDLPRPSLIEQAKMRFATMNRLTGAGYLPVGIDHYARPHDPIAQAKARGSLTRTVLGYGTGRSRGVMGIGVSAVSTLPCHYFQNYYTLSDYYAELRQGRLPLLRSHACSGEDLLRQRIIFDLIIWGEADKQAIEDAFNIRFDDFFAPDLAELDELIQDGLVVMDKDRIRLTDWGRLNPRHAAWAFDGHHRSREAYAQSREVGNGRSSLVRRRHFASRTS
jgi:oxygen-independent coproporphyrinogen-3 oxidase